MIVTITQAEIIAAIQGSGSITKQGVTLTFNNCYVDNGKSYMKHDYTTGVDNIVSRYFTDYGSVNINSTTGNIMSITGFYGCNDKNINIEGNTYNVFTKDITFYPSNSWTYGIKYNNILHKFIFPERIYFETGTNLCKHGVDSNAKNEKYLYSATPTLRYIRPFDGEKFRFNDGTTVNELYAVFGYFVNAGAYDYDPGLNPNQGSVNNIKGEVTIENFKKYISIYNKSNIAITGYDVELLPVVERTYDIDSGIDGVLYDINSARIGTSDIQIVVEDTLNITTGIVNALENATYDEENERYEKTIHAEEGKYFNALTIYTYVENRNVDVVARGLEYTDRFEVITTPSPEKLLKEVVSIVKTETPSVDVVASGVKGTSDYSLTTNHSTGKLIKSITSKVNFENKTINSLTGATLVGSTYTKKTNPSFNKLIDEVTTQVYVENKTLTETNIINKDTITPSSGALINSIVIPELYASYNVDYNDLEHAPHPIKTSKKLVYPLSIDLYKTVDKSFGVKDLLNTFTQVQTIVNNAIIPNVNINIKSATCDVDESDITPTPHSIHPPKDTVFDRVDINAILGKVKLSDIEVRDITFVEPRVPTIYYGIYLQLLKKFADNANKLLDDCECNCKHNNYNQKLISCWNLFHYACALYMEDSDSKMAQNIIKLIVSQLNLMYKEDEDFLISKYYIGKYKNETSDENEFNNVSIFDLTPVEIDVCSEKEFNIELNHDTSVHYIMLPPDVELRKVWYNDCGIVQILFDKDTGINEYNSKLYKLTDFGNNSGVIYWYYCSTPINNIQIECGKKK